VPAQSRGKNAATTHGELRTRTRRVGTAVGVLTSALSSGPGAPRPRADGSPKAHTTPSASATSVCVPQMATAATPTPLSPATCVGVACGPAWPRLPSALNSPQVNSSPFSVMAHEAESCAFTSLIRWPMSAATRCGVRSSRPWPLASSSPHP